MQHISETLYKIIHKDNDFCCLCLKTIVGDRTELDDEVVLLENNTQRILKTCDIISFVLGDEVFSSISSFQAICLLCASSVVNSYKFIKETKENIRHLSNTIENLNNCFNVPTTYIKGSKTLFITMNLNNGTSNQYYDNVGPIIDTAEALERLETIQSLNNPEKLLKLNQIKKESNESERFKSKKKISTLDMLLDKNDQSVLKCKECWKEFLNIPNLRNHYLRIHAPKEFKCTDCSKSYGTMSFLNAHRAESHVGMVCSDCGKTFTNMQKFKRHEDTHYMRLVCQSCGRVYKNRNTFKKHIENNVCQTAVRHSPADAKYTCDYCQKKYTQKISLRVHIQYEHGNYKSHVCKWCDKKFWCQSRLKAHIVKHTKEKNFICTICSGKFVTKESLLYHTRIHTGERPYPCPLCDSRFLSASRRAAHVRSQHTDPTVKCGICHSKFKTLQYLIKHKRIHEKLDKKACELAAVEENNGEDSTIESKTQSEILNQYGTFTDMEHQKIVYNIIRTDDDHIELKRNTSYMTHKAKDDHQNATDETQDAQVYFEVIEDGDYIKVSENVEV